MKYILVAFLFVCAVQCLPQAELEEGEVAVRPAQWGCGGGCSCSSSCSVTWMCKPCMPSCCSKPPMIIRVPVPVPVFISSCCSSSDQSCCNSSSSCCNSSNQSCCNSG